MAQQQGPQQGQIQPPPDQNAGQGFNPQLPAARPSRARKNHHLFQQSFLGASITNFSLSLGFNSNSTTLNVSLIEDSKEISPSASEQGTGFFRNPNAILEGYHAWDVHAFPLDLYDADPAGQRFGVDCRDKATTGPNDPGSCVADGGGRFRPWKHCACADLEGRRQDEQVPDYNNRGDFFFKPEPGSPVYFHYKQREFGPSHPEHTPPPLPAAEDPDDYSDITVLEFNGLFKNVTQNWDSQGRAFQVTVEDPRVLLEGTTILLGEKFTQPVVPGDSSNATIASAVFGQPPLHNPLIDFHDGKDASELDVHGNPFRFPRPIQNNRVIDDGYIGYYNILNVFGYYEFAWQKPNVFGNDSLKDKERATKGRFGDADYTDIGMVWFNPNKIIEAPFGGYEDDPKTKTGKVEKHAFGILPALQDILMGENEKYISLNEPMGGPLYYGTDTRNTVKNKEAILLKGDINETRRSTYRYKVDLSELYQLHKDVNRGLVFTVDDKSAGLCYDAPFPDGVVTSHRDSEACNDAGFFWEQDGVCTSSGGTIVSSTMTETACTDDDITNTWEPSQKDVKVPGGTLDSSLRINETEITLLSLIQTICEEAGADFFVELIRDPKPDNTFGPGYKDYEGHATTAGPYAAGIGGAVNPMKQQLSTYAGTIKVRVVTRFDQMRVLPDIIQESINESIGGHKGYWTEEQFNYDGSSMGYREPIIESANVGYEFTDAPTGVFMLGGPRSRVVGVTPLGDFRSRTDEGYDYNQDGKPDTFAIEYLPSTEYDGADLAYVTGSIPKDDYRDERNAGTCTNKLGDDVAAASMAECTAEGICTDAANVQTGETTVKDCHDAGNNWDFNAWGAGWSNDDYRAWTNDFHPFDTTAHAKKARMDKLNIASRGKCTEALSEGSEGDETTNPDFNSEAECQSAGKCFLCVGAAINPASAPNRPTCRTKEECLANDGSWNDATVGGDTREQCQDMDNTGDPSATWFPNSFEKGDGYLDLYPVWGFKTELKEITETPTDGFVKTAIRGDPIMGLFHDDDPYRDFDENDGIYSTKEWFNPDQGYCSDQSRKFDEFGVELRFKEYRQNCLIQTECIIVKGERKKIETPTGHRYYLHCHHPYGRGGGLYQEMVSDPLCEDAATGTILLNADGNPIQDEADCRFAGGTFKRNATGDIKPKYTPFDRSDGAFECIFHDEPNPEQGLDHIRQKMQGACSDDAYSSKKDCEDNAVCKDGKGTVQPPTDPYECIRNGLCLDLATDSDVGIVDEFTCVDDPDFWAGGKPLNRWVAHIWTGWDTSEGDLIKPYTASIPVNFNLIDKYDFGPYEPDYHKDETSKSYYYATVTELRHAAVDQDAWFKYLEVHDSWLPCKMGWKECITEIDSKDGRVRHAMQKMFVGPSGRTFGTPATAVATTTTGSMLPYTCEGDRGDLTPEEREKMEKNFLWRIVNEVSTNYYGKAYLAPLPFAPPLEEGCSTKAVCLDDSDIEVEVGGKPVTTEDDCIDAAVTLGMSTTWQKYDTKTECERAFHQWGLYGVQSEWISSSSAANTELELFDLKWNLTNEGWPFNTAGECRDKNNLYGTALAPAFFGYNVLLDKKTENECFEFAMSEAPYGVIYPDDIEWIEDTPILDNTKEKKNLRYPPSPNFWTEGGNLQPFVTYPKTEIQRLRPGVSGGMGPIDTRHLVSFREFDPESFHHDEHSTIASSDAAVDGTVFTKCEIDPKTYWLPQDPTWEQHHLQTYERKCYPGPPSPTSEPALTTKTQKECEDNGNYWRGEKVISTFLRPYALMTIDASARYDRPDHYMDERSQKFPEGEPKLNDCPDIMAVCKGHGVGGGVSIIGAFTEDACHDKGGVWHKAEADWKCRHTDGCEWKDGGGVCIDANGNLVAGTPTMKKSDCIKQGTCFNTDTDPPVDTGDADEESCLGRNTADIPGQCREKGTHKNQFVDDKTTCLSFLDEDGVTLYYWVEPIAGVTNHTWNPHKWTTQSGCHAKKIDPANKHNKLVDGVNLCIPLTKIRDTRDSQAWLTAAMSKMFVRDVDAGPGQDMNRWPMVSAIFKPYYAGIPQESTRYFWGPWSTGTGFGKTVYLNDSSYTPAAFNAESEMGAAARARCLADVNEFRILQESESGSVTVSGPPFYKLGDFITLAQSPALIALLLRKKLRGLPAPFFMSGPTATPFFGPLLTDISVDVGPDGITTTYNMKRQIKFGNLQAIYEKRMREAVKKINSLRQKQELDLQRSRLPDPQSFREHYKDR